MMFGKILVANRGEIACRVMATARRMGIGTVAVYSDADARALHVELADEAYAIGPPPARQSYLRSDAILDVARRSGAQAIHPGYGFLSENAEFSQACVEAGVVFVGPPPSAIRAMGSKAAAKSLMQAAGVPLVPGYHGADQSLATLRDAADSIGYPVLLKASAGGGGRGMRVVQAPAELADAIENARGEARAAFGDDSLLVEKYLTRPRHIEVQVFADMHGDTVSLFERDCSIQRRHQKVVEESPAPGITAEQRDALGRTAIAAAQAVGYVGAGTVEFIWEDDRFYFMEMNTRLQVEHPVTEFVTGLDLVEWQFRVAAGEALPLRQDALRLDGHAIEVRVCAEEPAQDFRPATGTIVHLRQPAAGPHVRVDTGVREGDQVTPNYDSLLAKLIVWGEDRDAARRRLRAALDGYELAGVRTNLDLLRGVAADPEFAAGGVNTGFIGRHPELLVPAQSPAPAIWAAAALSVLGEGGVAQAGDPWSPWALADGWRLNTATQESVTLRHADAVVQIAALREPGGRWRLETPGGVITARLRPTGDAAMLETENGALHVRVLSAGETITVFARGHGTIFTLVEALAPPAARGADAGKLTAPTPARVVAVFVAAGHAVAKGARLLTLEAMKVETVFVAPRDGVVEAVHVRPEELIAEGTILVTLEALQAV